MKTEHCTCHHPDKYDEPNDAEHGRAHAGQLWVDPDRGFGGVYKELFRKPDGTLTLRHWCDDIPGCHDRHCSELLPAVKKGHAIICKTQVHCFSKNCE